MNYSKINYEVMTDTKKQYESVAELKEAVKSSIERQYMVAQEDNIDQPIVENSKTQYVCSGKRSFEAAKAYKGVITSAAPELMKMNYTPKNYVEIITSRIKKILDVAAKEKVEVLILGAWGCGAFKNDSNIVSNAFYSLLKNYNFEVVEFALSSKGDVSNSPFNKA